MNADIEPAKGLSLMRTARLWPTGSMGQDDAFLSLISALPNHIEIKVPYAAQGRNRTLVRYGSIPDKPNMALTTQLKRIRRHDPKYSHALVCFKFMYVCILRGSGIGRGRLPGHRKI